MQRRYTAATLLLLISVAGCSSGPPPLSLPQGALPGGTAQVTVDGNTSGTIRDVRCESVGKGLTLINIGKPDNRVTALLGSDGRNATEVSFHDFGGFTGSYWQNLEGDVRLGIIDQTYTLTGTAAGFGGEHAHTRTMNDFTVKVAC